MRALLFVILAAGCYRADDFESGKLPCSKQDHLCPSGYHCVTAIDRCYKDGQEPDLSMPSDLGGYDLAGADLAGLDLAGLDLASDDLTVGPDLSMPDDLAGADLSASQDMATADHAIPNDFHMPNDFASEDLRDATVAPDLTDLESRDLVREDLLTPPDLTDLQVVVAVPQLTSSSPSSPSNQATPQVNGSAAPNASIKFYLGSCGSTLLTTAIANGSGNFQANVPVAIDANNSIVATATVGGITSACSLPLAYVEDQTKPGIPGNVQATGGNGTVFVQWNPTSDDRSGVASYEVTCTGSGCPPTITGLTSLTTTVSGLGNCGSYSFTVRARDNAGNLGDASGAALATTVLPSPSPIVYVSGPSQIEYSFAPVPNATSYVVCHSTTANACSTGTGVATNRTGGALFGVASDGATASVKMAVIAKQGSCSSVPSADSTQIVPSMFSRFTSNGVIAGGQLGTSLTMLGDLDGDGYPEYLAGAPTPPNMSGAMSSAYVFSTANNGAQMCHALGVPGQPSRPQDYFGSAVAAGDVNGDGKPDLIVGAPLYAQDFAPSNFNRGEIWLFDGATCTTNPPTYSPFQSRSGNMGDQLGWSVAFLGDLDGDGKGEYAAGAPGGKYVAVFKGSDGSAFYANITNSALGFGRSLATIPDINGDGYNDLVVGATDSSVNPGAVMVYSGKTGAQINPGTPLNGAAGDKLGSSVANVGDVNGDGIPDFAAAGNGNHVVNVYSGASFQVLWTKTGDYVAAMGDLDRDGRADFAVANGGSLTMYSGFDGSFLYSFGSNGITALAFGGHLQDADLPGILVGEGTANTNAGEVQAFVINNVALEIVNGEWIDPFGFQGYGPTSTPAVAPAGQRIFSHYGGTDPATWTIATNGSGASLSGLPADPHYHPGPTTPRLDLLRVTDSLNRSADTRVLAADLVAPSPTPQPRPAMLDATPFSSTRIDLTWMDPGNATGFTVEYRQATQAWVRFVAASPNCSAGNCGVDVTGLTPNTHYLFRVQATNAATGGMSLWSRSVDAPTPP
jgi:hypothetical protein